MTPMPATHLLTFSITDGLRTEIEEYSGDGSKKTIPLHAKSSENARELPQLEILVTAEWRHAH
jgi:hypothetical protein